jgi:cytidylate kinase
MHSENFDREEAQSYVEEVDRARLAFVRKFFKVDADDATLYHMVLNMDKMEAKTAAAVIVHACGDLSS